jgi:hypothetical protein
MSFGAGLPTGYTVDTALAGVIGVMGVTGVFGVAVTCVSGGNSSGDCHRCIAGLSGFFRWIVVSRKLDVSTLNPLPRGDFSGGASSSRVRFGLEPRGRAAPREWDMVKPFGGITSLGGGSDFCGVWYAAPAFCWDCGVPTDGRCSDGTGLAGGPLRGGVGRFRIDGVDGIESPNISGIDLLICRCSGGGGVGGAMATVSFGSSSRAVVSSGIDCTGIFASSSVTSFALLDLSFTLGVIFFAPVFFGLCDFALFILFVLLAEVTDAIPDFGVSAADTTPSLV